LSNGIQQNQNKKKIVKLGLTFGIGGKPLMSGIS
jgi:hypothetical protein